MNASDVLSSPQWLPVAFGPNKTILFQNFGDSGVADSTFLDNRAKGVSNEKVQIPAPKLVNYAKGMKDKQPINELFHISHVGSTLIAKVVQSVPGSVSYREPTIFRDVVNKLYDFHTGANPFYAKEIPVILAAIYAMFTRGQEDLVFIKQTSGNLILPVKPDEKASGQIPQTLRSAYLYTSAKDFLSHACKSQGALGDSVQSAPRRVAYFNRLCTFRKLEIADLKPLEKVALIWLTEMQKLRARSSLSGHTNAINFDACLRADGKESIVDSLCQSYELDEHRDALMDSPAWETNSKNGEPFDLNARTETIKKNYLAHKIDVEKALTWVRQICDENVNFASLAPDIE